MIDWPAIYTHVIASTGWTWEYIADHMDLPRLYAMNDYWDSHPPIHIMVAAYLGIKPKTTKASDPAENDPDEVASFVAMFAPK